MNPVLRLVHYIRTRENLDFMLGYIQIAETLRELAPAALREHDRLRMRVAELERENKRLKDPRDRVMTDLA